MDFCYNTSHWIFSWEQCLLRRNVLYSLYSIIEHQQCILYCWIYSNTLVGLLFAIVQTIFQLLNITRSIICYRWTPFNVFSIVKYHPYIVFFTSYCLLLNVIVSIFFCLTPFTVCSIVKYNTFHFVLLNTIHSIGYYSTSYTPLSIVELSHDNLLMRCKS